jgi:hypothetical protein
MPCILTTKNLDYKDKQKNAHYQVRNNNLTLHMPQIPKFFLSNRPLASIPLKDTGFRLPIIERPICHSAPDKELEFSRNMSTARIRTWVRCKGEGKVDPQLHRPVGPSPFAELSFDLMGAAAKCYKIWRIVCHCPYLPPMSRIALHVGGDQECRRSMYIGLCQRGE